MSVTRIEIDNGDVNIENFSSERATVRIQNTGITKEKDEAFFYISNQQAQDLYEALEVYIKSRTDN